MVNAPIVATTSLGDLHPSPPEQWLGLHKIRQKYINVLIIYCDDKIVVGLVEAISALQRINGKKLFDDQFVENCTTILIKTLRTLIQSTCCSCAVLEGRSSGLPAPPGYCCEGQKLSSVNLHFQDELF